MIGWIILAAYAIGWVGFSVTITRFFQKDDFMHATKAVDKAILITLGMLLAFFWPLVIPGGWVYKKVFATKDKEV